MATVRHPGKRELNKRATRTALQAAADRKFAEQGFEQTTVRDIAAAAGVTERTFFRYFASKEELVLDEALSWLPRLSRAISERPRQESQLTAVGRALVVVAAEIEATGRPTPAWIFSAGPPAERLRRPGTLLVSIERVIADALRERAQVVSGSSDSFRCEVAARAAVSAARSALLHDLDPQPPTDAATRLDLLATAFATLGAADILVV